MDSTAEGTDQSCSYRLVRAFLDFTAYTEENEPDKWTSSGTWANGAFDNDEPGVSFLNYEIVYYGSQCEAEKSIKTLEDAVN